jgi:rhodanese-related sulfurtransferase
MEATKSSFYLGFVLFITPIVGMLAFRSFASKIVSNSTKRHISSSVPMFASVKSMNVIEFDEILKGIDRRKYQIVDVREKDELQTVKITDADIINLPLRSADTWTQKVINGELLDSEKPTLCLCHHGVRSMKVATFLGKF